MATRWNTAHEFNKEEGYVLPEGSITIDEQEQEQSATVVVAEEGAEEAKPTTTYVHAQAMQAMQAQVSRDVELDYMVNTRDGPVMKKTVFKVSELDAKTSSSSQPKNSKNSKSTLSTSKQSSSVNAKNSNSSSTKQTSSSSSSSSAVKRAGSSD